MSTEAAKDTPSGESAKATAETPRWPMFGASYWEALAPLNGYLSEYMVSFSTSLVEFSQKRLNHNIEAATRLASCQRPEDVMTVQRGWIETAAEDYRNDGAELLRAAGELYAEMAKVPAQGLNAVSGAQKASRKR